MKTLGVIELNNYPYSHIEKKYLLWKKLPIFYKLLKHLWKKFLRKHLTVKIGSYIRVSFNCKVVELLNSKCIWNKASNKHIFFCRSSSLWKSGRQFWCTIQGKHFYFPCFSSVQIDLVGIKAKCYFIEVPALVTEMSL